MNAPSAVSIPDCIKETESFLNEHTLTRSLEDLLFDPLTGEAVPLQADKRSEKDSESEHGQVANASKERLERKQAQQAQTSSGRSSNLDFYSSQRRAMKNQLRPCLETRRKGSAPFN